MDPNPIADNDPFTLGDSEDESYAKDKSGAGAQDKGEDAERLRKAAAEAMADSLVDEGKKGDAGSKS